MSSTLKREFHIIVWAVISAYIVSIIMLYFRENQEIASRFFYISPVLLGVTHVAFQLLPGDKPFTFSFLGSLCAFGGIAIVAPITTVFHLDQILLIWVCVLILGLTSLIAACALRNRMSLEQRTTRIAYWMYLLPAIYVAIAWRIFLHTEFRKEHLYVSLVLQMVILAIGISLVYCAAIVIQKLDDRDKTTTRAHPETRPPS